MAIGHCITIEPGTCGGRPCIRGLRIRVKDILAALAYAAPQSDPMRQASVPRPY
jgi:uncharacterized protein (DUF433 family)